MRIQLSDHFSYGKLLRFTLPSIVMMIFTSIYGVVDGLFVSNFVGKNSFAAVNFIMPFLMILGTVGFVFGAGGSALIAKTLGEGDRRKANRIFSLLVYSALICGVVIGVIAFAAMRIVASGLGAEGELLENCVIYGRFIAVSLPAFILQMSFQSFFISAEKPQLGLLTTIASGVTNMLLDALFVGAFRWGIEGAALATGISQAVGGIVPLLYFFRKNDSLLQLGKTEFDKSVLGKTFTNGSSELMSNLSMSLVGMLYNMQLMKYAGEDGVAAYGVLMYVCMIFIAVFIGYSVGSAPVVGYHYGAGNHAELTNLLKKSFVIIMIMSICMLLLAEVLGTPLAKIFVGYDEGLFALTQRGFQIFSFSFLFSGVAIYGSSFFTALSNGPVSALIAFLRTLVFQIAAVLLLPLIWGIDGIWVSIVVAEMAACVVSLVFIVAKRKKYHY